MTSFKAFPRALTGFCGLRAIAALVPCLLLVGLGNVVASASAAVPVLTVRTIGLPTDLPPGGEGKLLLQVTNLGDAPALGETSPVVVADRLPAGLVATAISGAACEFATLVRCEYRSPIRPYDPVQIEITVKVDKDASSKLVNEVSVSGGGAASATARNVVTVSAEPAEYGVEDLQLSPTNEDGSIDTQAGSHPFQLTTTFEVNNSPQPKLEEGPLSGGYGEVRDQPAGLTKDLHFNLPAGLVGNPETTPQCTSQEFDALLANQLNECPAETAVGIATVDLSDGGLFTQPVPVFNLVPAFGEPARFGIMFLHTPIILDASVSAGGEYRVVVSINNVSQVYPLFGAQMTLWGVPADPAHNALRGWNCLRDTIIFGNEHFPCPAAAHPRLTPFLTLPTSCPGPAGMSTTVEADSWSEPGKFKDAESVLGEGAGESLGLVGCGRLPFSPSIGVAPDGSAGSTPSGLTVGVHVSQEGALNPTGLGSSDVRDTTVTLPEGVQISPSGADGLLACSTGQIGFTGVASQTGMNLFTAGAGDCPDGSKIGTVELKTPLLPEALEGGIYLAAQDANPFGSLIGAYLEAESQKEGVDIKLAGEVRLNEQTGQIVTEFPNTPQLPLEEARLHFFGSDRAPLSTPAGCGSYTSVASIAPWSGNAPSGASSTFQITSGPNGSACPPSSLPFSPSLTAGTTNISAGSFSDLTTTLSREDGQQSIQSVTLHYPPGLSGLLTGVELCPEAQANAGSCGPNSQLGESIVSVGLGSDPFSVTGGKVYLTGPYEGAPFGLSIVNPAKAGPFELQEGRPVVVRAKVEVDPHTAALTVTTNTPADGYAIPSMIEGIPLQIKHVNITINRPGFTFNPTSCNPTSVTGTIASVEGASAPISTPFQVTNCASLKFAPEFSASTSGKASKADGASLTVKLAYPKAPQGTYANIGSVKVELPKALPSRLTTLQKACTDAQFEANPAGCPAESKIGYATVRTPLLPVPLTGPAIFVSHGGEAFPSLTMVLQGYGVTVDLVGTTFISKAGVTSTTFKTVPDVPFSTFELVLPEGPYSALSTDLPHESHDLCGQSLVIPTEFLPQDGGNPLKQDATIAVTGCAPAITVVSHKVKGKTATIQVSVPAAGKLVATGEGLSKASKTATGATTLTLRLTLTNGEAALLSKHKGRKLKAKINVGFTPKKGGKLKTTTTVLID